MAYARRWRLNGIARSPLIGRALNSAACEERRSAVRFLSDRDVVLTARSAAQPAPPHQRWEYASFLRSDAAAIGSRGRAYFPSYLRYGAFRRTMRPPALSPPSYPVSRSRRGIGFCLVARRVARIHFVMRGQRMASLFCDR